MRKIIGGALMGAALAAAVPAVAATTFTVGLGSPLTAIPLNNDFKNDLNAVGLTDYTAAGASITLSNATRLKFEYMGSESGFTDTFTAAGGTVGPFNEYNKSWGPVLIGYANYAGGVISDFVFTSNGPGQVGTPGTAPFAIFIPGNVRSYVSNVLYLGFDDQLNNADDNHDDFIVRVTAVPEPASWAMLVIGFGLVGMTTRRRSLTQVSA